MNPEAIEKAYQQINFGKDFSKIGTLTCPICNKIFYITDGQMEKVCEHLKAKLGI